MIYGEESAVITFGGGLWITETPDSPEGFVRELKNLQLDSLGSLVVRNSILGAFFELDGNYIQSVEITKPQSGLRNVISGASNLIHGSFLGNINNPNDVPVYIEPNHYNKIGAGPGLPYHLGTIHQGGNVVRDQQLNDIPGSNFVQYGTKVYVWIWSIGVVSVIGWNPGVPTVLTNTLIAGSPTTLTNLRSHLLIHKDRMFLFNEDGRVYFTDTADPGGYPETWDLAVNFFIVPVRAIENVFVLNDEVYIWTSNGLWKLQVYGPPESWILKNVLSNISIQDAVQVCLNKGVFYYVSSHQVIAFNGASGVNISKPIQTYLDKCHGIGVHAFENGVLVCGEIFNTVLQSPSVSVVGTESSKLFYFDAEAGSWSEIVISGQTAPIVTGSFVDVWSPISDNRPTTVFTMFLKTNQYNNSYRQQTFYISRLDCAGDSIVRSFSGSFVVASLPINFSVKTSHWVGTSHKEKRLKMGYIKLRSTLRRIFINTTADGVEIQSLQELEFNDDVEDDYYLQALKMPGFVRRVGFSVDGSVDPGSMTEDITTTPFNLIDIILIYNTGRNDEKVSSG